MRQRKSHPQPDYQKIRSLELELGIEPTVPPSPIYEAVERLQQVFNAYGLNTHPKQVEK